MTISRWFIGLANGSAGDAADAVLVETTGVGLQLSPRVVVHQRRSHPRDVQDLYGKTVSVGGTNSLGDIAALNRQLGESAAVAVQQLIAQSRFDASRVLAIGHLGPLAWHEPVGRMPSSFEVGMASILVERTGLSVLSEFRERDVAAGGQGMPITALADWAQFRDAKQARLLIHLGGVTSAVFIPANARPQDVVAFEIGPGTRLLDAVIRLGSGGKEHCDAGGKYAVQGHCRDSLLAGWLEHPYLHKPPPKSLSRSEYGAEWIDRAARAVVKEKGTLEDFLCTLSHLLVRCIALSLRWLPQTGEPLPIWLSGGGTRNGLFWRLLEHDLPGHSLHRLDELGVSVQARQAAAAAVLAAMTMDGIPANSPNATGAVGRLLGRVTPGEPRNWGKCLRWMAEQAAPELTNPYRAA